MTVWGGGAGFWQVDYPMTSFTFWTLMQMYTPIAVMTTSRRTNDTVWLLEIGSTNLPQSGWSVGLDWNNGRPPYIGGSPIDFALPNMNQAPRAGNPPDATRNQGVALQVPAAVNALQVTIVNALGAAIPAANLTPMQAAAVQGTAPDNYVSAYAGYHAVWYQAWRGNPLCKAGWHTHVGFNIALATATSAIRIQLDQLITWLNAN